MQHAAMVLRSAALSDVGRVRVRNEDRCLLAEELGAFGVADGVGGIPGGAEAAETAVETVLSRLQAASPGELPDLHGMMDAAASAVAERGRSINPGEGIATTLTFAVFKDGRAALAHVGDSRCYAWRQGALRRLTTDHLMDRALSRCLGHPISTAADYSAWVVEPGDRYLFCTDGLTQLVSDGELAAALRQPGSPEPVVRRLVEAALRRGGYDNVTAVAVFAEA